MAWYLETIGMTNIFIVIESRPGMTIDMLGTATRGNGSIFVTFQSR